MRPQAPEPLPNPCGHAYKKHHASFHPQLNPKMDSSETQNSGAAQTQNAVYQTGREKKPSSTDGLFSSWLSFSVSSVKWVQEQEQ